jgi:hypothetical protein
MSFCDPEAFRDWNSPLPDVKATVFEIWRGYGFLHKIEFITQDKTYPFENPTAEQDARSYRVSLMTRIWGLLILISAVVWAWLLSSFLLMLRKK